MKRERQFPQPSLATICAAGTHISSAARKQQGNIDNNDISIAAKNSHLSFRTTKNDITDHSAIS